MPLSRAATVCVWAPCVSRRRVPLSLSVVVQVAEKGAGSVFGELCLIGKRAKRNATVTAKGELRLLCLDGKAVASNPELEEWRKGLEKEVRHRPLHRGPCRMPLPSAPASHGRVIRCGLGR